MIDVAKPLELSDGTFVTLFKAYEGGSVIAVSPPHKTNTRDFYIKTGKPTVGHDKYMGWAIAGRTLRNVPEPAVQPMYDRMLSLVERIARDEVVANDEARAIMAELRPVDPDLLLARAIAVETSRQQWAGGEWSKRVERGEEDECDRVRIAFAALKRGRELAAR